jgi:hypothetical protein
VCVLERRANLSHRDVLEGVPEHHGGQGVHERLDPARVTSKLSATVSYLEEW